MGEAKRTLRDDDDDGDEPEQREPMSASGAFRVIEGRLDPAYERAAEGDVPLPERPEERLEFALQAGRVVAWDLDFATGKTRFSSNAEEVLGFLPGGRPASLDWELVHPDDRESLSRSLEDAARGTAPGDTEFRYLRRRDGAWIWVEGRGRIELDATGKVRVLHGMLVDVTERKRAEELRARAAKLELENQRIAEVSRAKSLFLQSMSHELRTPLNAIIGFTQLMHDGVVEPGSPEHQEFLGDVLSSGQHLLRLIEDLLELAEIDRLSSTLPVARPDTEG